MKNFIRVLRGLPPDETGVTSIEYALLASLIAMACIVAVGVLGANLDALYFTVCKAFPNANC